MRGRRLAEIAAAAILALTTLCLSAPDADASRARRVARPVVHRRAPARWRPMSLVASGTPSFASALVIDAATGQVLYQKDPRAPRAPASLSKMMVELLAMEALRDKKMRLDEYVRVPDDIRLVGGSRVRLRPGEPVTVADLLDATAIASANDAATTLAVRIAGSTAACVALMNRRAHELGMNDTHYENVHGLDRAGEPGNITTAYDLSILARKLLEMPEILRIASTVQTTIRYGQVIHTTNRLLGRCEGVDGLKTGYTGRAGFCLVSTAQREGLRVISVVLGARSNVRRFSESAELLKEVYANWDLVRVVSKGQDLGQDLAVRDGRGDKVSLVAGEDMNVLVRSKRTSEIHFAVAAPPSTPAPVAEGWTLGRIQVMVGDSIAAEGRAVAGGTVKRAGLPGAIDGVIGALPH